MQYLQKNRIPWIERFKDSFSSSERSTKIPRSGRLKHVPRFDLLAASFDRVTLSTTGHFSPCKKGPFADEVEQSGKYVSMRLCTHSGNQGSAKLHTWQWTDYRFEKVCSSPTQMHSLIMQTDLLAEGHQGLRSVAVCAAWGLSQEGRKHQAHVSWVFLGIGRVCLIINFIYSDYLHDTYLKRAAEPQIRKCSCSAPSENAVDMIASCHKLYPCSDFSAADCASLCFTELYAVLKLNILLK